MHLALNSEDSTKKLESHLTGYSESRAPRGAKPFKLPLQSPTFELKPVDVTDHTIVFKQDRTYAEIKE